MATTPLPFQSEPPGDRLRRRCLTVGVTTVTALILLALLPFVGLFGTLWGLLLPKTRFGFLRTFLAATWAVCLELYGLVLLGWGWLVYSGDEEQLGIHTVDVQTRWTQLHLGALKRLFTLSLSVDGLDCVRPRPTIILMRHTSMLDTVLPPALLVPRTAVRMRYVLKRELLMDPCLDVAGNRMPNLFLERRARGAAADAELVAMEELARTMEGNEAVVLFPEGTRASAGKRRRALARLEEQALEDPRAERLLAKALPLRHLLPIRLGGAMALLRGNPDADIVFVAHTGLEELAGFRSLVSGQLVGSVLRLQFWRPTVERPPPEASEARLEDWLLDRWLEVDQAVAELQEDAASAPQPHDP